MLGPINIGAKQWRYDRRTQKEMFAGHASKFDSINSRGFNLPSSEPTLEYGQPILYLSTRDESYLTLGALTATSKIITKVNRFPDSGINTDTLATSQIFYTFNYQALSPHPTLQWNNNATTGAQCHWAWGGTGSLPFMHRDVGAFTMYIVAWPLLNENSVSTSKVLLSNVNSTSDVGFSFSLLEPSVNVPTVDPINGRRYGFIVYNATPGNFATVFLFPEFDNRLSYGPQVMSIRWQNTLDTNVVGGCPGRGYVNGKYIGDIILRSACSSSTTAAAALSIGALPNATAIYRGYCADVIVDNRIHDDVTHARIVKALKYRHGIL